MRKFQEEKLGNLSRKIVKFLVDKKWEILDKISTRKIQNYSLGKLREILSKF